MQRCAEAAGPAAHQLRLVSPLPGIWAAAQEQVLLAAVLTHAGDWQQLLRAQQAPALRLGRARSRGRQLPLKLAAKGAVSWQQEWAHLVIAQPAACEQVTAAAEQACPLASNHPAEPSVEWLGQAAVHAVHAALCRRPPQLLAGREQQTQMMAEHPDVQHPGGLL